MKKTTLAFLLSLAWSLGFSQNRQAEIDSLKHELAIGTADTSRVLAMTGLARTYQTYKPDSSIHYAQQALLLARKINYPKGEFWALFRMGFTLGLVGNYPRALEMQLKALRIAEKNNFLNGKAEVINRLGTIYRDAGDYSKAIVFHQRARLLFDSLQYHDQSAGAQNQLSIDYFLMNKTDSAQYYAQLTYETTNRWKIEWMRSSNFLEMGRVQSKLGKFPLALDYLQKSAHYAHVRQTYFFSTQAYLLIAKVYQQTNQPDSTFFYAQKALADAQKGNLYQQIGEASLFLSSLYEQKNAPLALQYQQTALAAKDSLSNFGNLTAIQNQVAFDEEERQYEMETAQTAWRNQVWRYALLAGLGVVLLVSFILFRNNRQKQKANALLHSKNRALEIETALERVRARTMAMHRSDDLLNVITVVGIELHQIGIQFDWVNILTDLVKKEGLTAWQTVIGLQEPLKVYIPYFDHVLFKALEELSTNNVEIWTYSLDENELKLWFGHVFSKTTFKDLPGELKQKRLNAKSCDISVVALKNNVFLSLAIHDGVPYTAEQNNIIKRFGKVFEQAYTRFLDLHKAEAQAREAHIEAALERVRSRTMAMHKSDELAEVVAVIYQEVGKLGLANWGCNLQILNEEEKTMEIWISKDLHDILPLPYYFRDAKHPDILAEWDVWRNKTRQHTLSLKGESKKSYDDYVLTHTDFKLFPDEMKRGIRSFDEVHFNMAWMQYGFIVSVNTATALDKAQFDILSRFAKVFEQTYTRFLDLQKAEAQAREAQIEAALERVRARTMAMHNSVDVTSATETMFEELKKLGIDTLRCGIANIHHNKTMDVFGVTNLAGGYTMSGFGLFGMDEHPIWQRLFESWKNKEEVFIAYIAGQEKEEYFNNINNHLNYLPQNIVQFPDSFFHAFYFEQGIVWVYSLSQHSEPEKEIMKRFATGFSLTFRRYQDLKKAEAQAREATIEAALEKVRGKAMAMQTSEDVVSATSVLFNELENLGIKTMRCGILLIDETQTMEVWTSVFTNDGQVTKIIGSLDMNLHPLLHGIFISWKQKEDIYSYKLIGPDIKKYYAAIAKAYQPYSALAQTPDLPDHYCHVYFFEEGGLYTFSLDEHNEETRQVLNRFTAVFSLTFRRYQDLKQAEAQLREAQIEAALERVRSRALAMRHSDELSEAAELLYNEFLKMGVESFSCGYLINDDEKGEWKIWLTNPGEPFFKEFWTIPYEADHNLKARYESWKSQEPFHCTVLEGEENRAHHTVISKFAPWKEAMLDTLPPQLVFNSAHFSLGHLLVISPDRLAPDLEQAMVRFAKVFDLTWRRFLDLQKAEARAREAKIDAGLDRVRAEIASMRSTEDLERITPLVWRELTTLGMPFFRCGVFIMDEENERVHTYLSTPDGKSLSVLHLPFDAAETTRKTVEHWRKQEVYLDNWDKQQFTEWVQSLTEQGYIKESKAYQGAEQPPEALALHFVPFKQGMLYVGNSEKLSEEQVSLVQRLADTFAVAYARYEDFTKLEEAKKQVESAFTELKATQAQLIQSEKLASLGELTAGIAHEIQNPLNFVNNFSELSVDLAEELKLEIGKLLAPLGEIPAQDKEFVGEILSDLTQNQQKINHHGKRAAAIVTGMLQHARTSTGKKEPTDLNALADEYLRLSYHGLRAKDSSFNAQMVTDFDPAIGKVEVVPQDIGRVFLNLLNNAFYATQQRRANVGEVSNLADVDDAKVNGYEPTVSVSSKRTGGGIEFRIRDNGTGIPDGVKARIFQPFFTTKPTGQGTGLGLSLAYDIVVKGHGGTLEVESAEGIGTAFILRLTATM